MSDKNYLDMSDDEIMGMSAPEPAEAPAETTQQATVADETEAAKAGVDTGADTGHNDDGEAVGGSEEGDQPVETTGEADSDEEATVAGEQNSNDNNNQPMADSKDTQSTEVTPPAAPATKNYSEMTLREKAAAFDRMTAPFKANGRMIETKNIDEEIQLKQMGANYTQKMQVLQPQLRIIKMLENNNLLDESKLSHLIDLSQKNPLAIQKLLADAEFDPLSVDAEQAAGYTPGNYQVSDAEMAFQSALDEIETTETGTELILEIARQYDQESKQALYQNPDLVRSLNQQRANGIYSQIDSEVQRLKALGQIGPQVPYLQSYLAVGDMLHSQGRLAARQEARSIEQVPVETRAARPAQPVSNNERVQGAAPTRATSPAPVQRNDSADILNLPDAEFLKQMQGRV